MNSRKLSPQSLLLILTGLNLFNYLDRFVAVQMAEPLKQFFNLTDHQTGQINTAFMIGYFLTAPVFGYLGDRITRKWLIAAGILVWSVGTVLSGLATGFVVLLSCRILVGLGEASYATIGPSLISDSYPPARRNNALTIFYVAIPVGAALGYFLGSQIESRLGWRYAFVLAGIPGLLLAGALLPFREPERGAAESLPKQHLPKPKISDALKLLRLPDFSLVVWGYVAYTFALAAFGFWGPSYLERILHMSHVQAGTYFGVLTGVAGLISTFAGGFAATAWRKRNPAAYSLTLGISTLAAVPFSLWAFLGDTKFAILAGLAGAILLLFLGTGPVNTLILETVPVNLRATAMAMSIFMIHMFGDFWSPEITGYLSDHFGGLQHAVLALPFALLVAAGFWIALAVKTLRQPPSPVPSNSI